MRVRGYRQITFCRFLSLLHKNSFQKKMKESTSPTSTTASPRRLLWRTSKPPWKEFTICTLNLMVFAARIEVNWKGISLSNSLSLQLTPVSSRNAKLILAPPHQLASDLVGGITPLLALASNSCGILGMRPRCNRPTTSRPESTANLIAVIVRKLIQDSLHEIYGTLSACKRGSPQYMTGASQNEDEPVNNCQTAASCTSNYECTSIGSMQLCCPTVASVCR